MPYAGKFLQARDFAAYTTGWSGDEQVKAMAVADAESSYCAGAWHDNYGDDGALKSRDCGVWQINIDAQYVGTEVETGLRTDSKDPAVYEPVVWANTRRAHTLYNADWVRDGKLDKRRWQAWVAYTTGWAMFPYAWVWHQEDGVPVGPWVASGRFVHKAIRGLANWKIYTRGQSPEQALLWATTKSAHLGLKQVLWRYDGERAGVVAVYEPVPALPPADGVGPRPVPNNGR